MIKMSIRNGRILTAFLFDFGGLIPFVQSLFIRREMIWKWVRGFASLLGAYCQRRQREEELN